MINDIERMLDNGSTPESIYQEALRIVEAKNAAKVKMKKNIDDARDNAIKAFLKYVEVLTGEKVPASEVERIKREFAEIQEDIESMMSVFSPNKREEKDAVESSTYRLKKNTNPIEDTKNDMSKEQDAIQKFLKDIGAL